MVASIKINIILKTSSDSPLPWIVVYAEDHIPPIRLSVLIGECVHNMRSAIDNLVCGLALTLKPTCKCRGLAFPLFKDQAEWDKEAEQTTEGHSAGREGGDSPTSALGRHRIAESADHPEQTQQSR